jgi:exopolysaccharide biosynthesis protein
MLRPFTLLLVLLLTMVANAHGQSVAWAKIGDDLQTGQAIIGSTSLFSAELVLVRTTLHRYQVGVIRAADYGRKTFDAKEAARLSKAVVTINANFFDEQGKPLGVVINRGLLHQDIHRGGRTLTGIFKVGRDRLEILDRQAFSADDALEAVQAGPRLIAKGNIIKSISDNESTRRSGLCIDGEQRLVLFAVSSSLTGLTIGELQQTLASAAVRCEDALNLDGGGSTQLFIAGQVAGGTEEGREIFIRGRDEVPVMLGLFLKD